MQEMRDNFWVVMGTKWKKFTTFYGGKWGKLYCISTNGADSHRAGKNSLFSMQC